MAAKIRKNDLVEVVRGRTSDEKALAERNARRAEEGLEPLTPGDKGKQGRVIQVFPAEGKVLVEGINLKTRHVRQGQQGSAGGIETIEAPHLAVQGRTGRPRDQEARSRRFPRGHRRARRPHPHRPSPRGSWWREARR